MIKKYIPELTPPFVTDEEQTNHIDAIKAKLLEAIGNSDDNSVIYALAELAVDINNNQDGLVESIFAEVIGMYKPK